MTDSRWKQLIADLRQVESIDRAVAAADLLQRESEATDAGRLRELLKDGIRSVNRVGGLEQELRG